MKKIAFLFIAFLFSAGWYSNQVLGADLTLSKGGRVAIELISSDADYHNTLSLVSPNASVVV
jgi:hypothetical protein